MRKIMLVTLLLAAVALSANAPQLKVLTPVSNAQIASSIHRDETVVYYEDFEGETDWVHYDGTLPSSMWHSFTGTDAWDGGPTWWMGDEALGGYINNLYVVMDTPAINVTSGNSTLTFKLAYAAEGTTGTDPGWDGWDGCNVRISTDGGDTFTVISGTPAYNCSSLFSFGNIHGEGQGIAGWGGEADGWQDASFDLSSYVGDDVIIRFAFASDGAYSAGEDPDLFGMMVDNISLGDFTNDGSGDVMTFSSMVPVGGDLWHLAEVADAPSQSHAMVCQNDSDTYNINMQNYVESPLITLPNSGEIKADVMVKGAFSDNDTFPDVDFWGFEISIDNGVSWRYMSNPYALSGGDNYVYSDAPDAWSSAIESYQLSGRIDDFAGMDVKFRLYFESDGDDPIGTGFMVDDFKITNTPFLPAPYDLTGEENNGSVVLNWADPFAGGAEGWLHWDSGTFSSMVGNVEEATAYSGAGRYDATDLLPYSGGYITRIRFASAQSDEYLNDYTVAVKIWDAYSAELVSQDVPTFTYNDWNEVVLDNPLEIQAGMELFIGYSCSSVIGYPIGLDGGVVEPGKGAWLSRDGGVFSQYTESGNVCAQALVETADGRVMPITLNRNQNRDLPVFTNYRVYRHDDTNTEWQLIADNVTETTYTDTEPVGGSVNYYQVTSVYETGESSPTDTVSEFIYSATWMEHIYDDGTSEDSYLQSGAFYGVHFTPYINPDAGHVKLVKINIYSAQLGTASSLISIYADNGDNNMPGTSLAMIPVAAGNFQTGWNLIDLPASANIDITSGGFYVLVRGMADAFRIGIDTDTSGNSYLQENSVSDWEAYNNGNFMIRAVVDHFVNTDADDEVVPVAPKAVLGNYPNPFNPETKVYFNLPAPEKASVKVYDLRGRLVKTLVNNETVSNNSINWNGTDNNGNSVASGIYFVRLKGQTTDISRKMMLLK